MSTVAIPDLIELSSINENSTYTYANGGIIGSVDNATLTSPRTAPDGNIHNNDDYVTIDGVDYQIVDMRTPNSAAYDDRVTVQTADGGQHELTGDDSAPTEVLFMTLRPVSGGADRYFMLVDDSVGDVEKINSVQTRNFDGDSNAEIHYTQDNNVSSVCFCAGTLIATPDGARDVAELRAGDAVITLDHGIQRLVWAGRSDLEADAPARLAPIRIAAGALGSGLPQRTMRVSPQHRMLLRSPIAARLFDSAEVLVPATKLLALQGVTRDTGGGATAYHHLLFRHHEIVFAEGAPSESLLLGAEARRVMPDAARRLALIVARGSARPARRIVSRRAEVDLLLLRHMKNAKPMIAA